MAVVHTVVHSHHTLVVELVKSAETEHTERAAGILPTECKVQDGGNLKIAYNAEFGDETAEGRCSVRPA